MFPTTKNRTVLSSHHRIYFRHHPFVGDPLAANKDWAASMSSEWVFKTTRLQIHLRRMMMTIGKMIIMKMMMTIVKMITMMI